MKTEELMIGDCIKNTINHEYYISLEVAKLLKEAGFDWKCRGIYVLDSENDPEYIFSTANFTNTSKEIEGYILSKELKRIFIEFWDDYSINKKYERNKDWFSSATQFGQ